MAARRIGQYIPDWVRLSARVPAEGKVDMNRFRTIYDSLKTSLDSVSAKPEPIDWSFYERNVSKPGMVESFRKAYEAITVPYTKDTQTERIDSFEKDMEQESLRLLKESQVRIKEYEAELDKIRAQKPFEDMTTDEYLDLHPELREQSEEELKKYIWK